jgi:hypothetical protein
VSNNALADFATAPTWFNNGAPDYVNQTYPTDTDNNSIGCGMAFISWLLSRNIALGTIAQELVALGASGTFAQLYGNLTSNNPNTAWLTFMGAVRGLSNGVISDDPFGAIPSIRTALAMIGPRSHPLLPPSS